MITNPLPTGASSATVRPAVRPDTTRLLLLAGILSSILWIATDVVASTLNEGFSYKNQTVSELSAIGSPTRPYVLAAVAVTGALSMAFAVGVWRSAAGHGMLKTIAVLLMLNALINFVLTPFSSMHQREVLAAGGGTFSDTLHLTIAAVNVFIYLIVLLLGGALALGSRFRIYSVATIAVLLAFGGLTSLAAPDVASNGPTPWIGITERVSAYGWMTWVVVLAIVLLRRGNDSSNPDGNRRASRLVS